MTGRTGTAPQPPAPDWLSTATVAACGVTLMATLGGWMILPGAALVAVAAVMARLGLRPRLPDGPPGRRTR
jgi:hypothetical protein